MELCVIDDLAALNQVTENWNNVYESDPLAQFFISWPWISGRLKRFDECAIPWFVLAAKSSQGHYVAFFPLTVSISKQNTARFYSKISMAGVEASNYPGFICLPAYEERVSQAFATYLQTQEYGSFLQLEHLQRTDVRMNRFIKEFMTESMECHEIDHSHYTNELDNVDNCIVPYINLPDSWDDYLQGLSTNTRQKIRRFLRKIDNSGDFSISHATQETIDQYLEILLQLWQKNWEGRKGAEKCKVIVYNMYINMRHCFQHGSLYLLVLWRGDTPIGAIANLIDHPQKTVMFYVGGRDETVKSPPPGFILQAYGIRHAIQNQFKVYDFLMGNEAYKYSFGPQERQLRSVLIHHKDWAKQTDLLNPRTIPEALKLTEKLHRSNQLDKAEQGYRQILEVQPQHPKALYGLSAIMQRKGEYASADDLLRYFLQVQPNDVKAWFSLGTLHQTQGHLTEAESAYRTLLSLSPAADVKFATYHNLGYTLEQQEKWKEAVDCYQRAKALKPENLETDVSLANAQHHQGLLSAEQQVQYAAINYDLGTKRQQAGDLEVAIAYYRQAIAMQPALTEAHNNLGRCLYAQDQANWQDAIDHYQTALTINPDYLEADVNLANIRYAQKQLSPDKQKHYAIMNNHLGVHYRQSEQLKPAIEYFQQAIAMNPKLADAYYNLGLGLQVQKKHSWEKVIACYQQVLTLAPNHHEAEANLGNILYAQAQLSQQQQNYYANINYQLGNQYRQKGELPIAIAYYRQAIHLNPDLTDVRQSLRTALEENDNVTIKVSCAKA